MLFWPLNFSNLYDNILKKLAPQNCPKLWDLDGPYGLTLFLVSFRPGILRCHSITTWTRRGKQVVSRKSTLDHVNKGQVLWKMSTIVHAMGVGGQNWVKFGPRSCWMTPQHRLGRLFQGRTTFVLYVLHSQWNLMDSRRLLKVCEVI